MGLEEMEWSQATRGQEDSDSHDAAVGVCHRLIRDQLIHPFQHGLHPHPRQKF